MKILLVEDNVSLCRNIASVLQNEGYTVVTCSNGNVAEFQMLNNSSDLILLDRMLPGKDGITLTREARAAGITVPILLLTALDTLGDKVTGLDAGADDYIVKPFAMEELLARLRAALRRGRYERGNPDRDASFFENGPLRIDFAAGSASVNGQEIHLAPMEYKLLCLLARNAGKVLTHKTILQAVWGSSLPQNLPSLRVFMATLRKKLENAAPRCDYIHTHVGVGYRMARLGETES